METNKERFSVMSGFFESLGIDYNQIKAIISSKKSMIKRQGLLSFGESFYQKNYIGFGLNFLLLFILGIPATIGMVFDSLFTAMTFSYSLIFTVLGLTFVAQFTTTLLDTSDNQILLPRPISGRTILAARSIYIFVYMGCLALFCGLPTLLAVGFKYGIYALFPFMFTLILTVFLLVFVAQFISFISLKLAKPRHVKNFIVFFLSIFAAVILISLNLFTSALNGEVDFENYTSIKLEGLWLYMYPPSWMAGVMSYSIDEYQSMHTRLAVLAIIVPIVGGFLTLNYLGSRFNSILSNLEIVIAEKDSGISSLASYLKSTLTYFCLQNTTEKAIFDLIAKIMSSDAAFKMRTYPMFGMLLAFIVSSIFLVPENTMINAPVTGDLLFFVLIYIGTSNMAAVINCLQYGERFRAAWVFRALPLSSPGVILSATAKAFICKFVLPLNMMVVTLTYIEWGVEVLADTIFASIVSLLMCFRQCYTMKLELVLPFSKDISVESSKINVYLQMLSLLFPILVFACLHFLVRYSFGQIGVIFLSFGVGVAVYLYQRKLRSLTWQDLEIAKNSKK